MPVKPSSGLRAKVQFLRYARKNHPPGCGSIPLRMPLQITQLMRKQTIPGTATCLQSSKHAVPAIPLHLYQ